MLRCGEAASALRKVTGMEAMVKTSLSIYPTATGVTLALQPHGAAEIKVEFSPLEALKQAHTLILHAMSHTLGPTGSTALPAVVGSWILHDSLPEKSLLSTSGKHSTP